MNLHNAEFVRSVTSVADCPKDGLPQIAFAGKSNVGKSSVINKLLLRKNFARVGEAPGKTTHINFFRIDEAMYLVDLPGYGYAKVPQKEKSDGAGSWRPILPRRIRSISASCSSMRATHRQRMTWSWQSTSCSPASPLWWLQTSWTS